MKKEFILTSKDGNMVVVVRAKNIVAAKNIAAKLFAARGH